MIHLDTSFIIRAMVPRSHEDAKLRRWLSKREAVAISSISWAEFLCGPVESTVINLVEQIVGEPLSFIAQDSVTAALLFNTSGRRRGSFVDCMIAAIALRHGAILATSNPDDFQRFVSVGLILA